MKTSSENGSDCNTALAREIKSILVVLWNVHTIVLICAFCNTLSSMAASFCFSYMEIWGYRRILGCSVKLWAIWLSSITLLKSLYSAQFLYLVIYLIKGILQFKKWSPGNEEKVTVFLSSQLGRKVLIFFFYPAGEIHPQNSNRVFFQSMKMLWNSNSWNSRQPQGSTTSGCAPLSPIYVKLLWDSSL